MSVSFHQIGPDEIPLFEGMLDVFAEAFEDPESYLNNRPHEKYSRGLLSRDSFIALVAIKDGDVVGGIAAYQLDKFEQARSEIYIYDLAVSVRHWRQGIAKGMIRDLQQIALVRGTFVIFVQADHGDDPAIALYTKLGDRAEVLHFDIPVPGGGYRVGQ